MAPASRRARHAPRAEDVLLTRVILGGLILMPIVLGMPAFAPLMKAADAHGRNGQPRRASHLRRDFLALCSCGCTRAPPTLQPLQAVQGRAGVVAGRFLLLKIFDLSYRIQPMTRLRFGILAAIIATMPASLHATPQFARKYQVDCAYCHVAPPRLNARGLAFLANNYRFEGLRPLPSHSTVPMAVWNTYDVERRHTADLTKGFPSRIELISAGSIGATRAAYFIEWRALSQNIGGNRRLLNRSGRFEDLFVKLPLTPGGSLAMTAGQFRALNQVDVSQRLSLSEPLAFSSSLPSPDAARTSRLTGLRAFSPSGRQPALRLEHQPRAEGRATADGWYTGVTLPLTGELTIPLADAASFEFEASLKGVFAEAYRRNGMSTFGGHAFAGRDRRLGSLVATHDLTSRVALVGSVGRFWTPAAADTRFSVGGEYTVSRFLIGGLRVDHRTAPSVDPALLLYGNVHVPFGRAAFRQALRLQIEQRVQRRNHVTTIGLSHIF